MVLSELLVWSFNIQLAFNIECNSRWCYQAKYHRTLLKNNQKFFFCSIPLNPSFFPTSSISLFTRFHSLIHFLPFSTLTMSFMLGWTAKSLTPVGIPPKGAVSPLGRSWALDIEALILESTVQFLVRVIVMVLSSAADKSFDLEEKYSALIPELWRKREPSSWLLGFCYVVLPASEAEGDKTFFSQTGGAVHGIGSLKLSTNVERNSI